MTPEKVDDYVIQLANSEYSALTTRCTNYETIEYVLLGSFLTFATIAAAIYTYRQGSAKKEVSVSNATFLWAFMVISQLFGIYEAKTMKEQMVATKYLESELRPMVSKIISHNTDFWRYETFLSKTRTGSLGDFFQDWIFLLVDVVGFIFIISSRRKDWRPRKDWPWLLVSFSLMVWFYINLYQGVTTKHQLGSYMQDHASGVSNTKPPTLTK